MQSTSLTDLTEQHLKAAREASSGRSATTLYGGQEHDLRQTLVALAGGRALGEHESPGEATLQVLQGHVKLHAGEDSWDGRTGELLVIPPVRHDLEAVEDSVVLLTVATSAIPSH